MKRFESIFLACVLATVLAGCSTLRPGEDRKVTAWGLWHAGPAGIVGLGYWHSERGDEVKSEESARPPAPPIPR